jgi:cation:H+ antiporter
LGKACNLHQGIVGSILAAIGTALPETIIPILAIMFSKSAGSHDVGIGAIAGAPFMLSTLAFFVTGVAVIIYSAMGKRTMVMNVDAQVIGKDLTFFLIIYGIAVGTTLIHEIVWLKILIALLLLLSYLLYLKLIVSHKGDLLENVAPLYLKRFFKVPENIPWISVQLVFGLILMLAGAHFFIKYIHPHCHGITGKTQFGHMGWTQQGDTGNRQSDRGDGISELFSRGIRDDFYPLEPGRPYPGFRGAGPFWRGH